MPKLNAKVRALGELPPRIAKLPLSPEGYPVPWFVAWMNEAGEPVRRGEGKPDFRYVHPGHLVEAHNKHLCWVCGEPLGIYKAFCIGPMCAANRVTAEPPGHFDCMVWSAKACPFLTSPKMRRNEKDKVEGSVAGVMIARNPGVVLVWVTKSYKPMKVENGVLFRIGDPWTTFWFAEGREATRAEIMHSFETGLPILRDMARKDGPAAERELDAQVAQAMLLVPAAP